MTKKLLILLLFYGFNSNAQSPLLSPSMPVTADGSVSSPAGEQVANITDGNINTKFLDFSYSDGFGFTINTGATPSITTRIDVTTANDSQERDPMNFEVLGSNDGSTFTSITTGTIPCVSTRFFTRSFSFTNTLDYKYYRVIFTNQCNTIEAMLQLAEVQLLGTVLATDDFSINQNKISIFPNPAQNYFSVNSSNSMPITKIGIYDLLGKTLKELTYLDMESQKDVDVSQMVTGIYLVKITTNDMETTKQLIIK